jgi:hypothetical protein
MSRLVQTAGSPADRLVKAQPRTYRIVRVTTYKDPIITEVEYYVQRLYWIGWFNVREMGGFADVFGVPKSFCSYLVALEWIDLRTSGYPRIKKEIIKSY